MADTFLPGNGFDTYETQDKVLVGLNGGVDSSVAACILQQQGFGVMGAAVCFAPAQDAAAEAAKRAAKQLGIECIVLKAEPDAAPGGPCGPEAQLAALAAAADRLGIQYIATGHYARVETDADGASHVCPPLSAAQDQSGLLAGLPQDLLARLILPLGEFEKADVLDLAREAKLEAAGAPG